MKARYFTGLLSAIASVVFILFLIHYLPLDAVGDEITSFGRYSISDFHNTVTNYSAPNNHIAFNIFQNFLSRIIGVNDSYEAMTEVFWFRVGQGLFSIFTIYFLFKFADKFFNRTTANIALIIGITTIPFYSYFTQLRGYNFSMLFAIILLYNTWSYFKDPKKKYFIGISCFTFLLLYTIPSNVYFILPLGLVWFFYWFDSIYLKIRCQKKTNAQEAKKIKILFQLLLAFGIGGLISFLAFSPVLEQLLNNRWVTRVPKNRFFVIEELLPLLTDYFLSGRYLLLPIFFMGTLLLFKHQKKFSQIWCVFVIIYILTFIVSFARNDLPFERTFAVLFPIFTLIISIPIGVLINSWDGQKLRQFGVSVLTIYCLITCYVEFHHIQKTLENNLILGKRFSGNYYNYFQADNYNPRATGALINNYYQKNPHPVLLVRHALDMTAQAEYLRLFGIESYLFFSFRKDKNKKQKNTSKKLDNAIIRYGEGDKSKRGHKLIKYVCNAKKFPRKVRKLGITIDYVEKHAASNKYYLVNSYDDQFLDFLKPFLEKKFYVEKLSKGVNCYNVYLLTKKKVSLK